MDKTLQDLMREHHALMRNYGRAQKRCSERMTEQARLIERLEAQAMRLRATVVVRESALAWCRRDDVPAPQGPVEEPANWEASLAAADLVICQIGCLSHDDYWRVRDHCRRTGKTCVLARQPAALRIVRIARKEPVA